VAVIFAAPPPLAPGEAPPPFDPRLLGWVFVLIVAADQVALVSAAVTAQGLEHWTIGEVTRADGAERVKIG